VARKTVTTGRIKKLFALLFIAAIIAGGIVWKRYQAFADHSIVLSSEERVLSVEAGDGFHNVLKKLRALGIKDGSDIEWKALAKQMKVTSRLQVGDYAISSGLSPRKILQRLEDGDIIQRRFTLIDGWNFRDLRKALKETKNLQHKIDDMNDAEVMAKLGAAGVHPEGRFLPETYMYSRGTSDLDILQRSFEAMEVALGDAWKSRDDGLPLESPEQLLTLASIIEKETGNADERAMISGVFIRRLNIGMRLQTDPTVIYGIGTAYDGNIRKKDLTTDTPYNTYTRDGLPPTPIAMPGIPALQAAAKPADGDALFFVARGDGSGRHVFSKNLSEHNAAVKSYLNNIR
jgi:UPF0755 protein